MLRNDHGKIRLVWREVFARVLRRLVLLITSSNRMLVENVKLTFAKFSLVSNSVQMSLKALFAFELLSTMIFTD